MKFRPPAGLGGGLAGRRAGAGTWQGLTSSTTSERMRAPSCVCVGKPAAGGRTTTNDDWTGGLTDKPDAEAWLHLRANQMRFGRRSPLMLMHASRE